MPTPTTQQPQNITGVVMYTERAGHTETMLVSDALHCKNLERRDKCKKTPQGKQLVTTKTLG